MPTKKKRSAKGLRASPQRQSPGFVIPMAAQVVDALPEGPQWSYELKLDGYRALIIKDRTSIKLRSRNDKDLMPLYPAVVPAGRRFLAEQAVIDGEIVAVDEQGRPSFQALQHRGTHPAHTIVFYAFDLLHLNGEDTTPWPLKKRRAKLVHVIKESGLLLSLELPGSVADIVSTVRGMQLEGIVAKRKDSVYEAGVRSGNWQKLKLERRQEFVIGGYRPFGNNSVDALLVGYFDQQQLRFAGKVRGGLVPHVKHQLARNIGVVTGLHFSQASVYWHLRAFPSRKAAEAAKSATGIVVEEDGRAWLSEFGPRNAAPRGGEAIAVVGPLQLPAAKSYAAVLSYAVMRPGDNSRVHTHPGPEGWYVLAGEQCLETPAGAIRARAGGTATVPPNTPMELNVTGTALRRAFALVIHDAAQQRGTSSDWKPPRVCSQ